MLDACCGCTLPYTNVDQYSSNNTDAQKWALSKRADGSVLFTNRASGMVLDISCGCIAPGSNVQLYSDNNTNAQKFQLTEAKLLNSGVRSIKSNVANDRYLDVPNCSLSSNQQLQSYSYNGCIAQNYLFKEVEDNVYTIRALCSRFYIGEYNGKVVQLSSNISNLVKWTPKWTVNGIALINVSTGHAIDVTAGSPNLGMPICAVSPNGTKAQGYLFPGGDPLGTGCTYEVYSCANTSGYVNLVGGSWNPCTSIQLWNGGGDTNSKWVFEKVNNTDYRIVSSKTGYVLDVDGGSKADCGRIQTYFWNGSAAQLWRINVDDDGWMYIVNVGSNKVLDLQRGQTRSGTPIQQYSKNKTAAQKWSFMLSNPVSLSGNGQLDNILKNICRSHPSLDSCFNYVAYNHGYRHGDTWPGGNWTVPYAIEMESTGSGNCYRFAALFMWCARALGYSANAICGQVPAAAGGLTPHGWVEVYLNGQTYVCDPDLAHELPGHNWYMTTYEAAPIDYYK